MKDLEQSQKKNDALEEAKKKAALEKGQNLADLMTVQDKHKLLLSQMSTPDTPPGTPPKKKLKKEDKKPEHPNHPNCLQFTDERDEIQRYIHQTLMGKVYSTPKPYQEESEQEKNNPERLGTCIRVKTSLISLVPGTPKFTPYIYSTLYAMHLRQYLRHAFTPNRWMGSVVHKRK